MEEKIVESDTEEEEILEERDDALGARARGGPSAAAIPAQIDPGIWLSMIIVKTPHLADLEVESMKKFILAISGIVRNVQQLLQKMQQFIL